MFTLVINNVTFDSELSESYILLYLKCIAYIYIYIYFLCTRIGNLVNLLN